MAVQELKAPKAGALCGKSPNKSPNTGYCKIRCSYRLRGFTMLSTGVILVGSVGM